MGWASGASLMRDIIAELKEEFRDKKTRVRIYEILIPAFQGHDWDTEADCFDLDPAFDAVIRHMYPDMFEDEPEEDES